MYVLPKKKIVYRYLKNGNFPPFLMGTSALTRTSTNRDNQCGTARPCPLSCEVDDRPAEAARITQPLGDKNPTASALFNYD